jgi:hypothetical protein
VLSSGNAVGTPALLPDGSVSVESMLGGTPITIGAAEASNRAELEGRSR